MKRTGRVILVAALAVVVAGGGYWFYQNKAQSSAAAADTGTFRQVVRVTEGNLSTTISVVGSLESEQSADLSFERLSGTTELLTLDVSAGNSVEEGQVLASIDTAEYQQALDQAQSDLLAAQETLDDLQTPATELEIAKADATLASAQQSLEQARANLADLQSPDLDSLQNAVLNAQDGIALAELKLQQADRGSTSKSVRDLSYTINWLNRRITELEALKVPTVEEAEELEDDREQLADDMGDLAKMQSELDLTKKSLEAELANAKLTLSEAQDDLAEAKAGGDAIDISQAQVAIQSAEVAVQSAQEARTELDEGADATTIANAKASVDKKQLAVDEAAEDLAAATITAPFAGTVLQVNVKVGDQVSSATTVLTVADLSTMDVLCSIDETTIRQISVGQSAEITFDAYSGQTFQGAVLSVPLQGSLQGGIMVYDVPISLEGADDLSLLVGMTANVEIAVSEANNALLVPTIALQKSSGMYQVLVPNASDPAGEPEAVPVEVGLSDGTYTQITRGLIAGDQVVVELSASDSTSAFRGMGGGGGDLFSSLSGMLGR